MLVPTFGVVGCGLFSDRQPEPQRWHGLVGDVRVQWSAEPGLDLTGGVVVPVRAYLESYDLVRFTGKLELAYPGFTRAVPPNETPEETPDAATWDRRPSLDNPQRSRLIGNMRYAVSAVERSGRDVTVTVCSYGYGLGEEQSDGTFATLPRGGFADERRIFGVRLNLTAPGDAVESPLPAQTGPALAPGSDVFGDWQIVGYTTTSGSSDADWPTRDAVVAACIANAPDPLERRSFLASGRHPATDFPMSAPKPGWPQTNG